MAFHSCLGLFQLILVSRQIGAMAMALAKCCSRQWTRIRMAEGQGGAGETFKTLEPGNHGSTWAWVLARKP